MGACCTTSNWPTQGESILAEYAVVLISERYANRKIPCTLALTTSRAAFIDKKKDLLLLEFAFADVTDILAVTMLNRITITINRNEMFRIECAQTNEIEEQFRFNKHMNSEYASESPFTGKIMKIIDETNKSVTIN